MTSVASRDLRNHTADVLRRVSEGADVTVTVNGQPVAVITRPPRQRPLTLSNHDIVALHASLRPDAGLRADLAWISADTTDDLHDLT